ncbi:VIN3-like protein 1 isoform X2 [Daucus carota subsp. sativus]|uniref:VIN3-like protein 1 isoform X2 n=1 Tax=Daucus carota subsp. sativus TaxID=79200 RepID=UPI0007EFDCCB|nr:PREDICTED: VIN3-like protein 1 isoform X3 [Daucus carota subsp. sativus]
MYIENYGKASGVQSLSSSVQSTPEKNGQSDGSRSPELLQEYLISGPRKDLFQTCLDKEKKHSASSKCKMLDHIPKSGNKTLKNQELKSASINPKNQPSKKQSRKAENPSRIPVVSQWSSDLKSSNLLICKNSACRATLNTSDTFCKRCSCCICHLFDDNKDPSLWLECAAESGDDESCGLSCHLECAFRRGKLGVLNLGQLLQLDGSYCCYSCGKVSGILGCWKKQLGIAKDARRVDILCSRVDISFRLLDGTSRFKDLHEIVSKLKAKLDEEVGPVSDVSAKMARGIVSRLSIASDVQTLCTLAIEKADEWVATVSGTNRNCIAEGSLPAACRFLFNEVTSSSVVIVLIELPTSPLKDILGYNLWYCKSREESYTNEPVCVFPRSQRRLLISNLLPCTEYSFRIVSYTEAGELGHSEATRFTKSVEITSLKKAAVNHIKETNQVVGSSSFDIEHKTSADVEFDSGFKVRDLGNILLLSWDRDQGCLDGVCHASVEKFRGASNTVKAECIKEDRLPPVSRELDLNVASVPDLNDELAPPVESSRDEDNECTLERAVSGDDAVSHDNQENGIVRSHGSGDSQNWTQIPTGEVSTLDSKGGRISRKRAASAIEETYDCDSTMINGSPSKIGKVSGSLDENFEYSVKIIRWLECEGYIKQEFRLKLLTWFSLRSTEQERRVVNTFIQTLIDDPSSLAGQLVDSFSDIVSDKTQQNGFCSKLWH